MERDQKNNGSCVFCSRFRPNIIRKNRDGNPPSLKQWSTYELHLEEQQNRSFIRKSTRFISICLVVFSGISQPKNSPTFGAWWSLSNQETICDSQSGSQSSQYKTLKTLLAVCSCESFHVLVWLFDCVCLVVFSNYPELITRQLWLT